MAEFYLIAPAKKVLDNAGLPISDPPPDVPFDVQGWRPIIHLGRWGLILWHCNGNATADDIDNWAGPGQKHWGWIQGTRPGLPSLVKIAIFDEVFRAAEASHRFAA
ncbi:MAG: hypothetical protein ACE5JS_19600 [Nitrospinota bacterium]